MIERERRPSEVVREMEATVARLFKKCEGLVEEQSRLLQELDALHDRQRAVGNLLDWQERKSSGRPTATRKPVIDCACTTDPDEDESGFDPECPVHGTPTCYFVDVPNSYDTAGPWINLTHFDTFAEAVEYCKQRFHADDEGRISLITPRESR